MLKKISDSTKKFTNNLKSVYVYNMNKKKLTKSICSHKNLLPVKNMIKANR